MAHTILIVEDDLEIRLSLKELLELEGYTVLLAGDGANALELLMKPQALPSLIILDLMMPIMNGWQFIKVKDQKPELAKIPVLTMSAVNDRSKVPLTHAYLSKPLCVDELLNTISNLLSSGQP